MLKLLILCVVLIIMSGCSGSKGTDSNVPIGPSNLSAHGISANTVQLQWTDNSDNENVFIVFRSQTGAFTQIGTVNANETSYNDNGLVDSTEYRYYVIANNENGNSAPSDTISASTRSVGHAPTIPASPSPSNSSANQGIRMNLQWQCTDSDNDSLSFDIYFGDTPNPPVLASNWPSLSYPIGDLSNGTTYYWRIIAHDSHRHMVEGPLWSFTTGSWQLSEVGQCATPGSSAQKIRISGNYAYVADFQYLTILDIANPAQPSVAASVDGQNSTYFIDVCVSGNYVYSATWRPWYNHDNDGGYAAYSITNPRNPVYFGSAGASSTGQGVAVSGNYVYVATHDSGLAIFNMANPGQRAGRYNYQFGYKDITAAGNYLYGTTGNTCEVISIANPLNPDYAGSCVVGQTGEVNAIFAEGQYVYLTEWFHGLHIVNVTTPSNPVLTGEMYDGAQGWDVFVYGDYAYMVTPQSLIVIGIEDRSAPMLLAQTDNLYGNGAGVCAQGDYVYVADMSSGVRIFRFTD